MSAYKNQRKAERRAEWMAEAEAREREEARLAARPMWQKIEEAEDIHDIKGILREIAERLDL